MNRNDHGHPESEQDLERMRAANNRRRSEEPGEPASRGNADHGVLSGRDEGRESTKAGSGTKGSHPKR
jgi:hypothetical protein